MDVAYLHQRIRIEYVSGKQALAQLDGKAKSEFIARKMEIVCGFVDQLAEVIGMQDALRVLSEVIHGEQYPIFSDQPADLPPINHLAEPGAEAVKKTAPALLSASPLKEGLPPHEKRGDSDDKAKKRRR